MAVEGNPLAHLFAMHDVALHLAILVIAILYSCVGHAGASGYIAALTLAGAAVTDIRPAALVLNLGVACLGIWHFVRGGHYRPRLIWPFIPAALPCAWLGARIGLSPTMISVILGVVLLMSAIRFMLPLSASKKEQEPQPPALWLAVFAGGVMGLLAGITGTGGGIFLTPLLLLAGWAQPKTAAAASIIFIAGNSLFGLFGFASHGDMLPWHLMSLLPMAVIGGFVGSRLGSFRLPPTAIRRLLAVVLLLASAKLLYGGLQA